MHEDNECHNMHTLDSERILVILTRTPCAGSHIFQQTGTIISKLSQGILSTNVLTKFHEDLTINVTSRVLTRKYHPPPLRIYFLTIFKHIQDIIKSNDLTKFHLCFSTNLNHFQTCFKYHWDESSDQVYEDLTINVVSRVKTSLPPGGSVFQPTGTIFIIVQDIIGTDLNEFHNEDLSINVYSRMLTNIIWTNLLTKFHEDRKINVASRVLTRKNAPSPGGHVFQPTDIIFELVQDIIGINLLTKFHEDWTINVASRVKTSLLPDWKINVAFRVLKRNKMCL
ncbi:hypothetical protein DPMN_104507 [Dreissena polymorpha]|uniref:Uncharacterized protein n=1 Tax=Dreissena polymorpha TaxID=45954 RepID=A0A9D4K047_DREPO|nr:hypothetical protein DPMN_104507 [Dreissena polymorpha]